MTTDWFTFCYNAVPVLLLVELRPHFSLASESDVADHDDDDDDDHHEPDRISARQSRAPPTATHDDTVATSGVSTLSSTVSHESHNAQRSVSMELGRMKLETNRWTPILAYVSLVGKVFSSWTCAMPAGCWSSCWRRSESTRASCNKCWRRGSRRSDYWGCDRSQQVGNTKLKLCSAPVQLNHCFDLNFYSSFSTRL